MGKLGRDTEAVIRDEDQYAFTRKGASGMKTVGEDGMKMMLLKLEWRR